MVIQRALFGVWRARTQGLFVVGGGDYIDWPFVALRRAATCDLVWKGGEKEGPLSAKPVITGYRRVTHINWRPNKRLSCFVVHVAFDKSNYVQDRKTAIEGFSILF